MTQPIRVRSRVAADGVLTLQIPLGAGEANTDVVVTVERARADEGDPAADRAEWHRFVDETYGSCAGLGLERQDQGTFEEREPIE